MKFKYLGENLDLTCYQIQKLNCFSSGTTVKNKISKQFICMMFNDHKKTTSHRFVNKISGIKDFYEEIINKTEQNLQFRIILKLLIYNFPLTNAQKKKKNQQFKSCVL